MSKFNIGPNLKKFLPVNQLALLSEYNQSQKEEMADVVSRLEKQLAEIPLKRPDKSFKNQTVHAHYFLGASDWFVLSYDEDANTFMAFVILNGDEENKELGPVSVSELLELSMPVKIKGQVKAAFHQGIELDFYWKKRTLKEVLNPDIKPQNPLIDDGYFHLNPGQVLGKEETKIRGDLGGKEEPIIIGSLDDALEQMNIAPLEPFSPKTDTPILKDPPDTDVDQAKDHLDRVLTKTTQDRIQVKKKAKKLREKKNPMEFMYSIKELFAILNPDISQEEIDAYCISNPEHFIARNYQQLFDSSKIKSSSEELIKKSLILFDNQGKYRYRYEYLQGDVSEKIKNLESNKENFIVQFGEGQFNKQIELLSNTLPTLKRVDAVNENERIVLVPHAELAKTTLISEVTEQAGFTIQEPTSLYAAFQKYLRAIPGDYFTISSRTDVLKYVRNKRFVLSDYEKRGLEPDQIKETVENLKRAAKESAEVLFKEFLSEAITDIEKQVINAQWNNKYNGLVEAQLNKIPVIFEFSSIFKHGAPLKLSETQRNGVAFRELKGSTLLGYDVGVGKTLTSIACASNALMIGDANRLLFVVPDATYKKWVYEIEGGLDKNKNWMYGAAPHLKLYKFGNLNTNIVQHEVKTYSDQEQKEIETLEKIKAQANDWISFVDVDKKVKEVKDFFSKFRDFVFTNSEINNLVDKYSNESFYSLEGVEQFKKIINDELNLCIYSMGEVKPLIEKSIILLNYTGMIRLGFNKDSRERLKNRLFEILSQGELDLKDEARLEQQIDDSIGKAMREAKLFIDDFNVDFLCIDEAHNMKKSFTKVKGEAIGEKNGSTKRESSRYSLSSGTPSQQAIHAFVLSQYIQQKTNGKNVLPLTATPFTNSPLEVYSMLALSNYNRLEETGKNNLKDFFDTYIKEENQIVIGASNKPEIKPVVTGFRNLAQLKQMMFDIIDYKTGEDAKVKRPEAISIPDLTADKRYGGAETFLKKTDLQQRYFEKIQRYIEGDDSILEICQDAMEFEDMCSYTSSYLEAIEGQDLEEEADSTRILRSLSFGKLLALSPHLFACNDLPCPTALEYVEFSPKLKYTMECIRNVKHWHQQRNEPMSGQVIYMNAGTRYFPLLKEFLINTTYGLGFDKNEVELVYGSISKSQKEKIKERFLAGEVKVVIGSASIKEGIDLQNRASCLYILFPDWNPTDYNQVKGRIWRQGNQFSYVRIVSVLMADTADVFVFQKLQEKTQRLKELLDRGNRVSQLDLESVNPEEIKENLITDPAIKAQVTVKRLKKEAQNKLLSIQNKAARLNSLQESYRSFMAIYPKIVRIANDFNRGFAELIKRLDREQYEKDLREHTASGKSKSSFKKVFDEKSKAYQPTVYDPEDLTQESIDQVNNRYRLILNKFRYEAAEPELKDIQIANDTVVKEFHILEQMITEFRKFRPEFLKGIEQLESMGMSINELHKAVYDTKQELIDIENEVNKIEGPENIEFLTEKNKKDRNAYLKSLKTLEERVEEFSALNHYMQHKITEEVETLDEEINQVEEKAVEEKGQSISIKIEAEARARRIRLLKMKAKYKSVA